MTPRENMLAAWKRFDQSASTRTGKATSLTLKVEAERLVETTRIYAETIDLSPVFLRDLLQAWRRAGLDHDLALVAVESGLRDSRAEG